MKPTEVTQILGTNPLGLKLKHPELGVLKPSIHEYTALLHQPKGEIALSSEGIGNRDRAAAIIQYRKLLEHAAQQQIQLVVTPEYSLPWQALVEAVLAGHTPSEGCLWALGCESLTVADLDALASRFGDHACILFEDLDRKAAATKRFLDPLAYVFRTVDDAGKNHLVILVQFKTHPCVEDAHIEMDHLICGDAVYVFGIRAQTIRLVTFICSDVFKTTDVILRSLRDRTLFLHIQLNPKPRESAYRAYRKAIFLVAKDETELICLNWSADIQSWNDGAPAASGWLNIGGSAWYLKPPKVDASDAHLGQNHRAGLYYTWHKDLHCHSLFLNYDPAAFVLRASKVWHDDVQQVQSRRTGPRLLSLLRWNPTTVQWDSADTSADGFAALVLPWTAEVGPLNHVYSKCPFATERLLILLQGKVSSPGDWHAVRELATCTIEDAERIRRITFAQDTDPDCVASRRAHIKSFVTCGQAVAVFKTWPAELEDLKTEFEWTWHADHPHSNVLSKEGKYATLIYMGDNAADEELQAVGDTLRTALLRSDHSPARLGILHRRGGAPILWLHPDAHRFDQPGNASPASITGA